ncbi:MAG: NAD(P)H-hydrate dehydratase [Bdellovibrionota bacterium]
MRGHVLILAGSKEKSGAAILSSLSSMRSGVGLCTLALPSAAHMIIKSQLINVMSEEIPSTEDSVFKNEGLDKILALFEGKSAMLIGPGLAPDSRRKSWIEKMVAQSLFPMVIDAQALSDLATDISEISFEKHHVAITPHEGEMSKLTGLSVQEIHENRTKTAQTFAKKWNVHVILKGHHTVVASPTGETWINMVDHPCLSVAGTGDVLAGILVSLLAQGMTMFEACQLSVYIHGRAGQKLGQRMGVRGVLASDLLTEIPQVLNELNQNQTTGA